MSDVSADALSAGATLNRENPMHPLPPEETVGYRAAADDTAEVDNARAGFFRSLVFAATAVLLVVAILLALVGIAGSMLSGA